MSFQAFQAKFKGKCDDCGGVIRVGQLIIGAGGKYSHAECPAPFKPEKCLLCPALSIQQTQRYGDDEDFEDFFIAYDRGCGDECDCDGRLYHINDFCSPSCLVDAMRLFYKES